MLNFIKEMLKAKTAFREVKMDMRTFNHIKTNSGYKLSIQCSKWHYCSPRITGGLNLYESFELAIIDEFSNSFAYPKILDDFPRKEELDEYYEGQVFACVPKDLVEDLYNYMNAL